YPGRPQLQKFSNAQDGFEYDSKIEKINMFLNQQLLDLVELKKVSWSGIPKKWRLLSKYLPSSSERRDTTLIHKRKSYHELRLQYFKLDGYDESQQDTYRQIHIDVPRMNPNISLFQQKSVQQMFERILFIWAIRHPASGYVQGINDLVTPFFIVFLQEILQDTNIEEISTLEETIRDSIEADSFWCLSKFLDSIQDNYVFAQLGIQEKVNQLKELIQRIDGSLHKHLQNHGIDYLQFSFRWMNNLLTRELPLHCTIRLWDTYLAESDDFAVFHLYVCAAFLLSWREQLLQQNDFQGLMLLLQNLPTHSWTDRQINVLVAEAFRLKFTYADTPKHLEIKS
uniref:Rab-GAP TBC domain-containing protein n=1 Tax=Megaselia scalaris TaxID=36166 RepID=T1H7I5_MEGSC